MSEVKTATKQPTVNENKTFFQTRLSPIKPVLSLNLVRPKFKTRLFQVEDYINERYFAQ